MSIYNSYLNFVQCSIYVSLDSPKTCISSLLYQNAGLLFLQKEVSLHILILDIANEYQYFLYMMQQYFPLPFVYNLISFACSGYMIHSLHVTHFTFQVQH